MDQIASLAQGLRRRRETEARCHAGPDKPALASSKPGASSLVFWIPLRLPVVKINIYNWPLRVVSLSNHDFYPPLED